MEAFDTILNWKLREAYTSSPAHMEEPASAQGRLSQLSPYQPVPSVEATLAYLSSPMCRLA